MRLYLLNLLLCILLAGCTGSAAAYSVPPQEAPQVQASPGAGLPLPSAGPAKTEAPALPVPPTQTPAAATSATAAPTATDASTATASPVVYAYGPANFPAHINPLTGQPVADPGLLERRPVAIKVTHFPRSVRPQWGLSLADHVYEYLIGDHMTRFIGIYYGTDASQVGPVRSARLFDEQVLRMYKSILVFGWADDRIAERLMQPDIRSRLVIERAGNCPPVCRLEVGHGYNNLFADTRLLTDYIRDRGTNDDRQNLDGLRFEMEVPRSGSPGGTVAIQFTNVSYHLWQYDAGSGQYLRSQEVEDDRGQEKRYTPLTDSLTGKQLAADNILVLRTPHEIFYQSTSTTILDQPFSGAGSGYAFRDGQIYPVTWTRAASDRLPSLSLPNGRPYPLKPGNVWFEILGETSTLTPQGEGAWGFDLHVGAVR